MAKIAKPTTQLIFIWRKLEGNTETYPYITRAYHRFAGKFVPIGWYLDDRQGNSMLITDEQVDNVDFA